MAVFSVGFNSGGGVDKRVYGIWRRMLKKCYGTGADERYWVAEEWHDYQVFAEWFESCVHNGEGYCLSNDILGQDPFLYSPDNCCLLPSDLYMLVKNLSSSSDVRYCKNKDRYKARMRVAGARKELGAYKTEDEARKAYVAARKEYVIGKIFECREKISADVYHALITKVEMWADIR